MKYRDLIKLIEEDGWYLHNTVGSHRAIQTSDQVGPHDGSWKPGKDVPEGTRKSILRQAEIK
jgi:predicted RNA binding protein YcfA (HicA-like mRNA interferase family)